MKMMIMMIEKKERMPTLESKVVNFSFSANDHFKVWLLILLFCISNANIKQKRVKRMHIWRQ